MITKYNKTYLLHLGQAAGIAIMIILPVLLFSFESFSELLQNKDGKSILLLSYFFYILMISFVFIKISFLLRKRRFHQLNIYNRLQFDFLQKQLDSHFTFNVLNTVSASILNDNKHEAYRQLTIFAKVLRYTYDNKTQLFHQLDNELELLNNYLQLEKYRFKEKFEYHINVGHEVDLMTHIPKQSIQIHVDNAIKHGLMPLKTGGLLNISIVKEEETIVITIEDNGVGREKAKTLNTYLTKSHSVTTIQNLINYFNGVKEGGGHHTECL
ncbi:MAG: histidine kinase [Bacteroidales bacterium]|nr:histidine kinase [Bacteroidales bacterium]